MSDSLIVPSLDRVEAMMAEKQNTVDDNLNTTDKTIVGAINEILPKATGVGKVDPNSDGTGEIFNFYEGEFEGDSANVASGRYSHAEGFHTTALNQGSHAEGHDTTASNVYSHAEGFRTTASGESSHAEGSMTTASGHHSHAEGDSTTAEGYGSHAEGRGTKATGEYSHAEGTESTASGFNSHAEGHDTTAEGAYSHTEGWGTTGLNPCEHAEGIYNKSYSSEDASVRVIHSVGIGDDAFSAKNAHEIKFNGDHYVFGLGRYNGTNSADAQTLQEVINSKQATITAGTGLEFEGNTLNVTLDTTVFKVVSALPDSPAQGDENKIHLVPAEDTGTNNIYTEYVWVNSAWEILGEYTSKVDLTPYLTKEAASGTYATKSELNSGLAGTTLSKYATTTALTEGLAGKANKSHTHAISDVTNLQNTLNNKAAVTHTHTVSQITDLNLGNYATKASVSQAISDATFNNGHNAVSSVTDIPVSKRLAIATISNDGSFTLASTPADGREIHVIVHNTSGSDIEITMPSGSNYVNMSGDTLTVAGSSYADINVISDGTKMYIRAL